MGCPTFSIPVMGSIETVLGKVKSAVQKEGGNFNGNNESGNFSVSVMLSSVSGTYTVKGQSLDITINSKPFFLNCKDIENYLKSKLVG